MQERATFNLRGNFRLYRREWLAGDIIAGIKCRLRVAFRLIHRQSFQRMVVTP